MFSPSKRQQRNKGGGTPTSPSRRRLNSSYEARLKSPRQKSASKNYSPSRGSLLKRERTQFFASPTALSTSSSKLTLRFNSNSNNSLQGGLNLSLGQNSFFNDSPGDNDVLNKQMSVGHHSVNWDGKDSYGNEVSAGIYIYTLEGNNIYMSRKMILMK